ncbi:MULTISPECIES: ABC transporter ATP-binding protein [Leptolyngbya]|jgi:subfamily B ATP-binding cassette protein MsbA|uniref:Xenobiotic-transporting ATPase n=2 Tax=Leptolyngbya boryana TaxID=1184 RepID=A0A1Z4JQR7_LEPBY|nr:MULTISPECIES: ABC transporter ATP-binding protein [Leptolyngbya]BAY58988.1 xenobiotic-transporting ATPase [Leptolyngbya boryana NIES-2135]MBD2368261.1 ABC transporter ATP-binding protein [Leptolyngbya sp. FACHB-161]MBD2374699.1 ABC transporter ATP-binding protein [Leptolyngbya sp. FACHB-238]MBD2399121.1 ABC transporter ATP-binding protein [Leptolyngbya sp. FACHB-239]MBD2405127.1 ABC transporter ATP-binding protein [Leptolyngbya sp. FACHB-402]
MLPNQLLLKFALRHPLPLIGTIVLGFSGALFNGVSTMLMIPVVLGLLGQEINLKGAPPLLQQAFASFEHLVGDARFLTMMACVLVAILLKNVTSYASTLTSGHLSRALVSDIRKEGLRLLLDVDLEFYVKTKVGDLINRLGGEVGATATAIRTAVQMLSTVITIFVFLIILLSISWQLTIISTVLLAIASLSNSFFVKRAEKFGQQLSDQSRDYSVAVLEMLSGIRLVKSTASESREYQKLEQLIHAREDADFRSQANASLIPPVNEMIGILVIVAILLLGRLFFRGQIEALSAILLTYLLILFRMLPFVGQLNNARGAFANLAPSVSVVNEFLRRDNKPFMSKGHIPYTAMTEGIRFENLSFTYPGHDRQVLNQVNLWLPKGTTLALVGSSGAGKSTLADLLPRFYDPTAGRILLDDRDLKDFELCTLRQSMGIVSQDTFLFNDSVRNNLAYARRDASDEQIIAAAKRANAYEFIVKLPQGFDTLIGDRGVMLSGGQRQRLAIARALLRDPEILILDEATSALDTVSERLVQGAIDELRRDRTTLVIAHRLSTIQTADQIAVLDKGHVVEIGTHADLLKQGGLYAQLHSMQFSEEPQTV